MGPAWAAGPASDGLPGTTAPADRERRSREWFTDTQLVDQQGRPHRFWSDLLAPRAQRRIVLAHPLFTTCSSACPLVVQRLKQMRAALDETLRRDLAILSISVDPLTDTPAQLMRFAQAQDADLPGWYFLGGRLADVERVARRLGLWTDQPEDHATTLIAGHPARAHWAKLRPDLDPRALAAHLERLA